MVGIRHAKNFLAASGGEEKNTLFRMFLPKKCLKRGIFMENVAKNADFFLFAAKGGKNFFLASVKFCLGGGGNST